MKLNKRAVSILLAKKKMNVPDLANAAGISKATINKGFKSDITPKYIGKIAEALGAKVEDIIQEE